MSDMSTTPLLSLRSAVIINLGLLIGVAAGLLTYAAHHGIPEAVLAGFGGTGTSVVVLNKLIARE